MNKKRFFQLLAALLVLLVLFCFTQRGNQAVRSRSVTLLSGIDLGSLAGLRIEHGTQSVELQLKDGTWSIPSKGGYEADSGKVRGLLLKLFDLAGSQLVTSSEKNFETLGVSDNNTEKGFSKVTISGQNGKKFAVLLAGDSRKSKTQGRNSGLASGQYVRRAGTNEVYLIGESLSLNGRPEDWLNTKVLDVASGSVRSVEQRRGSEREYLVERGPGAVALSAESAVITPPLAANEKVEEAVINQLGAGLENLLMKDVLTAKDAEEKLKDVPFDQSTSFATSSGLVYTVMSAEREGAGYLKFDVRFDSALGKKIEDEVKAANEKARAEFDAKQAKSAANKDEKTGKEPEAFVEQKASISTEADAERLRAKLSPWVYLVERYQLERFRRGRAGLLKHENQEGKEQEGKEQGEENRGGTEFGESEMPLAPD